MSQEQELDWQSFGLQTQSVRAGQKRTPENEHSDPIFVTSSYVFANARQAQARFAGEEPGNIYSRFTNPTVRTFEERLALMEGGERCIATASGMAAIMSLAMGLFKAGDHLVCSRAVFGNTILLFKNFFAKFGVDTTFVDLTDLDGWEAAIRPNTRLLFLETPSNPLTEIVDITALAQLAKAHDCLLVVDNVFCTPALQKPLRLGADIVVHSATKYLDGQGRCVGGAIVGRRELLDKEIYPFLRTGGATMSPFNAWVFLTGLETLAIRMQAHCQNALQLAQWLESHPRVERVYYPGLPSHPQYELARKQQQGAGGIVSFVVKGGQRGAWNVIDHTRLISITANLGDVKTTITHPATTTHGRLTAEERQQAGIDDGLLRISVGLEDIGDIIADLERGLGE
ncbi:MAG TPA: O-succinylhomoserine sulfhydrylase [Methylothermaceae bacterium]|nr:O-succinylhomoserine sulfhydrylase [Methylothermaceae bacterium]